VWSLGSSRISFLSIAHISFLSIAAVLAHVSGCRDASSSIRGNRNGADEAMVRRVLGCWRLSAGFGVVAVDDVLLDPASVGDVDAFGVCPFPDGPVLVAVHPGRCATAHAG
jgi:hypothetical protein